MNPKLYLIAGALSLLLVAGCSPEARYKTLSFFFDGVPPPGSQSAGVPTRQKTKGPQQQAGATGQYRTHGPYAAKLCNACHLPGGSNKLILPVEELCQNCHDLNIKKKHVHGPVASGGCRVCHNPHGSGKPFLLVSEPTTFCFYCHDTIEVQTREVHQAAGDMQCTDCHDPHASDEDFMMKQVPG